MREIDVVRQLLAQSGLKANPDIPWAMLREGMDAGGAQTPLAQGWSVSPIVLGARAAERHESDAAGADRAILYFHGGGYTVGSTTSHRALISQLAAAAEATVFAPDYRLAPENPFPAAFDDAYAAYQGVLGLGLSASRVVLAGDSAGAGLALALAMRLRDESAPAPCALALISPWADLTLSGRSYTTHADVDPVLSPQLMRRFAGDYAAGHELDAPQISPVFGDFAGLPPMLVQAGADDLVLSDAETIQDRGAKAGAFASLEVWPGMVHVWHMHFPILTPARDAIADLGGWLKRRWAQG